MYPDEYIVTCDDDMMYPQDWLEILLTDHEENPESIVAYMCRVFIYRDNELMPYLQWPFVSAGEKSSGKT